MLCPADHVGSSQSSQTQPLCDSRALYRQRADWQCVCKPARNNQSHQRYWRVSKHDTNNVLSVFSLFLHCITCHFLIWTIFPEYLHPKTLMDFVFCFHSFWLHLRHDSPPFWTHFFCTSPDTLTPVVWFPLGCTSCTNPACCSSCWMLPAHWGLTCTWQPSSSQAARSWIMSLWLD